MMAIVRTYRDLIAWQRAMALAKLVYIQTARMPPEERFGLVSQMRRAAISIPSNIAEGHARQSRADYLRFLRNARGSLAELSTQAELSQTLGLMTQETELFDLLSETDRVLQGLIRALENKAE